MAISKAEVLQHLQKAGVNSLDDLADKILEDSKSQRADTTSLSDKTIEQASPSLAIQGSWCFFHFPS